VTPEEAERMRAEVEKSYYRIELCDCDRGEYVISETDTHFLCKA
jgi:hypothetical protein